MARKEPAYAELHCKTNFTFLCGASHSEELVARAAELGQRALAITDVNSLAGVVRAHAAAKVANFKIVIGAEIVPSTAPESVLLYAPTIAAYRKLSSLITRGRRSAKKGECDLGFQDIADHADHLIAAVLLPASALDDELRLLAAYREVFRDRCYLATAFHRGPNDEAALAQRARLARQARLPLLATNDVHYHIPERRPLHEVLTAVRHGITVAELGALRFPNSERHLKTPAQMAELFAHSPLSSRGRGVWGEGALAHTVELADRCSFTLDELRYEYPEELCPPGMTPTQHLAELTWSEAKHRYPGGIPPKVVALLQHELTLIEELHYEAFFLTVWDLVKFARSRGILCQGRGSAANSAVCFCLGITSVDPDRTDLLFERFVSRERNEAPDIDVDFEHERREEVLQYIYRKYGRDRAGIVAEVICYRPRSAVRDVGKALGFSLDAVDRLARTFDPYADAADLAGGIREAGLDPRAPTVVQLVELATTLLGFPRHLSQHVGGFVITGGPLSELVPIENAAMPERTVIEWDKDDLDTLGILKVDCLSLGMLTAIRKCFDLIRAHHGVDIELATVPAEDPAVYDMICRADTVGVFQIESRAQMSMLPRLLPRRFYDLVIEVAIVRPGPIQGGMVHPFLRRRNEQEPVTYPSEAVKEVLSKTLGVPLFQEQVMRLAMVAAGFTPGEADQLRRAMGAWKRPGIIEKFRARLREGMLAQGLPLDFADQLYEQIRGFGSYGFPESHAASFALLAYVSAWLKCHYPAAFACALLNSQPMGFYAPAQIVRDAREHGVEVRPADVNASEWDCTLELRAGMELRAGSVSDGTFEGGTNHEMNVAGCHAFVDGARNRDAKCHHESMPSLPGTACFRDDTQETLPSRGIRESTAPGVSAPLSSRSEDIEPSNGITAGGEGSGVREAHQYSPRPQGEGSGVRGAHQYSPRPQGEGSGVRGADTMLTGWRAYEAGWHDFVNATLGHDPACGSEVKSVPLTPNPSPPAAMPLLGSMSSERGERGADAAIPLSSGSSSLVTRPSLTAYPPSLVPRPSPFALRLGLRLIRGMPNEQALAIAAARPFRSLGDLNRRVAVGRALLARLAAADAFGSLGLDRRRALWHVLALGNEPPLFADLDDDETQPPLAQMPLDREVRADYEAMGLSLKAHPISLVRGELDRLGVVQGKALGKLSDKASVCVAGLVLVRQQPSTSKGTIFMTLEDETGTINLVVWPRVWQRFRRLVRDAVAVLAVGKMERVSSVIHVIPDKLEDLSQSLRGLVARSRDFH